MNRGFRFYFAQAMRASCKSLWKKGNILKYLAYFIMSSMARLTGVFGAMFSLANVRQAKIAAKENAVDIPQSFKVACRAQPFLTMLLAILLEALIFISGLLLIGIASALLGSVGYVIGLFVDALPSNILIAIFLAPGGLIAIVYTVAMVLLFAPTAYIIETNPDIGAANTISICFNTMKSRGKWTYFLALFIPALVEIFILGLGVALEFVMWLYVPDTRIFISLAVLVGIIFVIAFALVAPMFALARKITVTSLFEDIVLDPVNASKRTNGVNIKRCKGVKFDPAEYENELTALFDETYSDRVPVPETDRARRKRLLAERKAAKAAYTAPAPEYVAEPVVPVTPVAPAYTEEEDGEILTVSELIRDVEPAATVEEPSAVTEPVAEPVVELAPEPVAEPVAKVEEPSPAPEPAPEPVAEPAAPAEELAQPEAEQTAPVTAQPEPEETVPAPAQPAEVEEVKEEVKEEAEVKEKPKRKTTATKTTATKAKPAATKAKTTTTKAKTVKKTAENKETPSTEDGTEK